ncbi:MAG: N-acetylmannosamine-6-phosphate 2-epimerase [Bacillota bacterium]
MTILNEIKKGLIVSCQALEDEPLNGSEIMVKMAKAAKMGGAVGIRANSPEDIAAIKKEIDLPVIGIHKQMKYNSNIYITPTIKEVSEIVKAGSDIVAIDATRRSRPDGQSLFDFIKEIKKQFNVPIMGDISILEEGKNAESAGVDLVGTTLSGYTDYSRKKKGPDFELLKNLVKELSIPVIMEGKITKPKEAKKALDIGAYAVVVGSAITRPRTITARFVDTIKN